MDKHRSALPRGAFLASAGLLTAALATPLRGQGAPMIGGGNAPTAIRGINTLLIGNQRFMTDSSICPPHSRERMELAEGQSPFAIVLSCSDSRVPVEIIFDQAPGAIFGVRIAGNFLDDNGLGSIEYGVAALKASTILVLGHTHCGALKAAVQHAKDGTTQPGFIERLVEALAPVAEASKESAGDWVENAIVANVRTTASALTQRSKILADAAKANTLHIAGGVYELHSGKVTIVT